MKPAHGDHRHGSGMIWPRHIGGAGLPGHVGGDDEVDFADLNRALGLFNAER